MSTRKSMLLELWYGYLQRTYVQLSSSAISRKIYRFSA